MIWFGREPEGSLYLTGPIDLHHTRLSLSMFPAPQLGEFRTPLLQQWSNRMTTQKTIAAVGFPGGARGKNGVRFFSPVLVANETGIPRIPNHPKRNIAESHISLSVIKEGA
jgi:hypothetical protein